MNHPNHLKNSEKEALSLARVILNSSTLVLNDDSLLLSNIIKKRKENAKLDFELKNLEANDKIRTAPLYKKKPIKYINTIFSFISLIIALITISIKVNPQYIRPKMIVREKVEIINENISKKDSTNDLTAVISPKSNIDTTLAQLEHIVPNLDSENVRKILKEILLNYHQIKDHENEISKRINDLIENLENK
ncbi:MAG: hypothetical protein AAGA77_05475 [Bacteroidota bacterium]